MDDIVIDGERLVFLGRAGATDQNGWFGEAPTGEWFGYRVVISQRMRNGKIAHDERIYDLTNVLQRFEKLRLDKELRMAADVQRTLLSRSAHLTSFCEAVGDSIPCRAIGGDFFEFASPAPECLVIAFGDVAGKGPASALLASMIQGMLAIEIGPGTGPATMVARLNRVFFHRGLEPRFATLVYGVLSSNGIFVYTNAGHNPPLLVNAQGVRPLTAGGPVVGAIESSSYEEQVVQLKSGDSLILYSDGVTEACDARGEEFGEDRLIALAKTTHARTAAETEHFILDSVRDFCRGAAQADDVTIAAVKYRT